MITVTGWEHRAAHTHELITAALDAAEPQHSVARCMKREGDVLQVNEKSYHLSKFRRVLLVGFGKASASMAQAAQAKLEGCLRGGVVLTKYGYSQPMERIEVIEAGHPLPDAAGVRGARRLLAFIGKTTPDDLIIMVVSGGGSALLTLPVEGISLEDLQALNDALLRSGATIHQINTIRKHLSDVKGGNLARRCYPANVVALVLSDVVGNDLDVIASGPMSPDPTTFAAAWEIIAAYGLEKELPSRVITHLHRGLRGETPETPKSNDLSFEKVQTVIVGDNRAACTAAVQRAQALGFDARLLTTSLQGEASKVGHDIVIKHLMQETTSGGSDCRPCCLVLGGETTVTVRGDGKGGRNQELALAAAMKLDETGIARARLVCFATDGGDGPTEASGAVADSDSVARAASLGLAAEEYLARNDSFSFFSALDDLIMTGPTGTNVNDLVIALLYS